MSEVKDLKERVKALMSANSSLQLEVATASAKATPHKQRMVASGGGEPLTRKWGCGDGCGV